MTTPAPCRPQAGFTMLEVLVAAVVLGIGVIGILGMQSTAAIANRRAYDMRAATELAETTLERLKRDAIEWTAASSTLDRSTWLGSGLRDANRGAWTSPPAIGAKQAMFNDMGLPNATTADIPTERAEMAEKGSRYCVEYRLDWVVPEQLARADVRVYWANNRQGERAMAGSCDVFSGDTVERDDFDQFFEWVRVSGMVRWNQTGAAAAQVPQNTGT